MAGISSNTSVADKLLLNLYRVRSFLVFIVRQKGFDSAFMSVQIDRLVLLLCLSLLVYGTSVRMINCFLCRFGATLTTPGRRALPPLFTLSTAGGASRKQCICIIICYNICQQIQHILFCLELLQKKIKSSAHNIVFLLPTPPCIFCRLQSACSECQCSVRQGRGELEGLSKYKGWFIHPQLFLRLSARN